MTDFFDQSSAVEEFQREAAISAQLAASRTPIPYCEECDSEHVHVTDKGTRLRYCRGCTFELTGRIF